MRVLPAPDMGIFHNTNDWGGAYLEPQPISETTGLILKILTAFDSPELCQSCRVKTNFVHLGVTDEVTGHVKIKKNIDIWNMFIFW